MLSLHMSVAHAIVPNFVLLFPYMTQIQLDIKHGSLGYVRWFTVGLVSIWHGNNSFFYILHVPPSFAHVKG